MKKVLRVIIVTLIKNFTTQNHRNQNQGKTLTVTM